MSDFQATAIISAIYAVPLDEEVPELDGHLSGLTELLDGHPVLASSYYAERERLGRNQEHLDWTFSEYYDELGLDDLALDGQSAISSDG